MGQIALVTPINNSPEVCFDLSTSIDLHKISTQHTKEEAIDGVRTGFIKLNEHVTWKARHFGLWFKLTTSITAYDRPNYFVDEMASGPFKSMKHIHRFDSVDGATIMTDNFIFTLPFGAPGRLIDKIFLNRYLRELLNTRNNTIREIAESDKWREFMQVHRR